MVPVDIHNDLRDRQQEEKNRAKVRSEIDLSPRLPAFLVASWGRAEPSRSAVTQGGPLIRRGKSCISPEIILEKTEMKSKQWKPGQEDPGHLFKRLVPGKRGQS
jgi:hypothetical protein